MDFLKGGAACAVGVGTPEADFNFGYGVEAQGRTITGTIKD